MSGNQFDTVISSVRFNRYLVACDYNRGKALKLYRLNLLLSQKIYSVVSMFEVVLRNSIDRHFISLKGNNWLEAAVHAGGYLDTPGCKKSFLTVHGAIRNLGIRCTHDQLITKLTFGFWRYQFAEMEFAASGSTLLNIFPNRPLDTSQKTIFKNLFTLNDIRNRIAHYEPICFDHRTGMISAAQTQRRYDLMIEMFEWLGCHPKKLLYGIDGVQKAINVLLFQN